MASTTLDEVKWNASLLKGDVAKELAAPKSRAGGHILKYGITALDRTLLDNKLVDEYDFWIMPTRSAQANEPLPTSIPTSSTWSSSAHTNSGTGSWSSRIVPTSRRVIKEKTRRTASFN
ncbi:MAG TPA: hypothetical protein VGJ20_13780 [Xanthobacteraceae bacterium]